MKKKTRMLRFHVSMYVIMLITLFSFKASAQCPAVGFQDSWPVGMANIGLTGHTSAYSIGNVYTVFGACDFVMSGWDDANPAQPAGVAWRLLQPATPSVIFNQGVISYTNVRDLEVGCIIVGGSPQMLVAYYQNGVGHMLDVYDITSGTPTLLYTNTLSTMTTYTRISMDCHDSYGVVIAWEDMCGINFVTGLNTAPVITFSPVLTLSNTKWDTSVDVAFSHSAQLLIQFVYYNLNTGDIIESSFDYWTAISTPVAQFVTPVIQDVNNIGICARPYINIDCPSHYFVDNWAYTYTTDNLNISVRLLDLSTSMTANTVIVNDGSILPVTPNNSFANIHPFLQYDAMCGPAIHVAWYTNSLCFSVVAGYIGLVMDATGTNLISLPDYVPVSNNPGLPSPTPVLSISKSDDVCPNFMYVIFPEFDSAPPDFSMENRYPTYCSYVFKGADNEVGHHESITCNDREKVTMFKKNHGFAEVTAYPNPFKQSFKLNIPSYCSKEKASIVLTDALGNNIALYNGKANEADAYFESKTKDLAAGSYFLNVIVEGKIKETLKLTKVQ